MKKLNIKDFNSLAKNIVSSDFLILDKKLTVNPKLQKKYKVLSLDEIIKNIKELCRTLNLINIERNFRLIIYVENSFNKDILDLLLRDFKKNLKITSSVEEVKKKTYFHNILIIIGNIEDNILKSFFLNNIYLIHILSEKLSLTINGSYNMQNNVLNIKKLTFLVTILLTIIKDYKDA